MNTQIQTAQASEKELPELSTVLGRAFFDDPLFRYIIPDEAVRAEQIAWMMGLGARYGLRYGQVFSTQGEVFGGAVWLPPGETDVLEERMLSVGAAELPARIGEDGFHRFGSFLEVCARLHHQHVPQQHWYLMILGVDPPVQGKGIGGQLMAPIFERADRDSLPCYLETQKEKNVSFYQKHGFRVVFELDLDNGPHLWTMLREPAR